MTKPCGKCAGCRENERRKRLVGYIYRTLDDEARALAEETALPRAVVASLLIVAQGAARRAGMEADEFMDMVEDMIAYATRDISVKEDGGREA